MFQLYELNEAEFSPCDTICQYKNIEIVPIKNKILTGALKERLHATYWWLLTFGKAKVYQIRNESGAIIHSSHVIPKCMKFPFMGKWDVEIGPCTTLPAYRGQGLYPYVLTEIVGHKLQKRGRIFMIVEDKNIASICGIEKVGFTPIAKIKKDWMKRYVIVK